VEERIAIGLAPEEVIRLLRAVLDDDAQEALRCLKEFVVPRVESARGRIHCRPAFELEALKRDLDAQTVPPSDKKEESL
jgi:hypothetical protein